MQRIAGLWKVTDRSGDSHEAPVVVNAAGSWCDVVAGLADARPVGIHPLRRRCSRSALPPRLDPQGIPLVADVAGTFYFKPEGPADPAVHPPMRCRRNHATRRPDELDIAKAIDVINAATTLDIRHVRSSWAGLRNFVADRTPVAGFDDEADGFFWFVGQGGYGIQMLRRWRRPALRWFAAAGCPTR